MTKLQQQSMLQSLSTIRGACITHLAIGHSLIPYDILTAVFESELNGEALSVKNLLIKLPYSDMGIRYHLRKLTNEGWIETIDATNDKRVKTIRPTEKLRTQFNLLGEALAKVLA